MCLDAWHSRCPPPSRYPPSSPSPPLPPPSPANPASLANIAKAQHSPARAWELLSAKHDLAGAPRVWKETKLVAAAHRWPRNFVFCGTLLAARRSCKGSMLRPEYPPPGRTRASRIRDRPSSDRHARRRGVIRTPPTEASASSDVGGGTHGEAPRWTNGKLSAAQSCTRTRTPESHPRLSATATGVCPLLPPAPCHYSDSRG